MMMKVCAQVEALIVAPVPAAELAVQTLVERWFRRGRLMQARDLSCQPASPCALGRDQQLKPTHMHCLRAALEPEEHLIQRTQRRSEEHTSELQSLMRISYAVSCLKKNTNLNYRTNKAPN